MTTVPKIVYLLFKSWMRDKASLFFGFALPIMFLLVFGTIFGGPTQPNYSLYIRNLDVDQQGNPEPLADAFIQALNASGVFDIKLLKPEEPAPKPTGFAAIRILTIPKGFTASLLNNTIATRIEITADTLQRLIEMAGENISPEARANITQGFNAMNQVKQFFKTEKKPIILEGSPDDKILQPIEGIINTVADRFELALLNASSTIEIDTVYSEVRRLSSVDYYVPGLVAAFIMTNGLIGVSSFTSELRRNGVMKLLASTPVSRTAWMISIITVQTIVALILTAVMIAVGLAVFRLTIIPAPFSIIIILLGAFAFTGFGTFIGGVLKTPDAVTALGNSLAFPMMFLSGAFWPLEIMPEFMQQIARFTPLYYFHVALRESLVIGSVSTALLPTAILAALACVGMALAAYATKWKDF
ncbi:MAG: ABC transporter permease [Candidatus Caldarchaeum sp.]